MLVQMVQQIDDKHEDGHGRLRRDFRTMETRVADLEKAQVANLLKFERTAVTTERRHELSANKTVILAAAIGGGFRLAEVLITALEHWLKP